MHLLWTPNTYGGAEAFTAEKTMAMRIQIKV